MANKDICRICGQPEDQHHTLEPSMPTGCVCDPGEWDGEVPDPCSEYAGDGVDYCYRCEHELACHHSFKST